MRTTLDLDEDILNAAKALAAQERKPVGQFVSELLREALPARGGGRAPCGRASGTGSGRSRPAGRW